MLNPSNNKRSMIELIVKLVLGLVIAALLAAIFIVLIVRFPINNNVISSQGQEAIIKLLIKSNEHIAELQREHEVQLEKVQLVHTDEYHHEDYLRHLSEQELQRNLTYEYLPRTDELNRKSREEERFHQWSLEQQRTSIVDQNRREDQERQDENDFDEFLNKYNLTDIPPSIFRTKSVEFNSSFSSFT